ncbi:hypothetical protein Q0812_04400 [Brevundimonas sp. 2R-24]|uniref:DUF2202 domain-containing protein n=1 Tax=Peiella sedimenti TaxID=3061083 RepID=A0ABT8SLZ8_9CAUL|nr:hypothetical protein [Caulobacteraceae bacterium XZ-24]
MLDADSLAALNEALDDEYRARATYQAVIEAFGPVRPFINIVAAEDRHVQALLALFTRFGVYPPPDRWAGNVRAASGVAEACEEAVRAEVENDAMYDRLLRQVQHPDVAAVMRRLQQASRERHLPAFQRCAGVAGRGGRPRWGRPGK